MPVSYQVVFVLGDTLCSSAMDGRLYVVLVTSMRFLA